MPLSQLENHPAEKSLRSLTPFCPGQNRVVYVYQKHTWKHRLLAECPSLYCQIRNYGKINTGKEQHRLRDPPRSLGTYCVRTCRRAHALRSANTGASRHYSSIFTAM